MKIKEMNEALQWLRDKYAVKADGTLTATAPDFIGAGAELKLADGTVAKLLPWRQERRFVELKKLVDGKTLEVVSTLRFAAMSAEKSLEKLLYRELDLCAFLGESPIVSVFAVTNGKTANAIVKLADDKSCSIECSAALPAGTGEMDRHEIIARRGVACDRTVDTQVPQSSIYQFTRDGEKRYTDTDTELFGFSADEITLIRAAFEVLQHPELAEIWNEADAKLTEITKAALESEKNGKPAIFAEEK